MIIGDDYVYIGIPRTASKSMAQYLCVYCGGRKWGHHHSWKLPAIDKWTLCRRDCTSKLIFTIGRHPANRALSIYRKARNAKPSDKTWPPPGDRTFSAVMHRVIDYAEHPENARNIYPVPEWMMNQAAYIKKAGIDLVLNFESLVVAAFQDIELSRLPFVKNRPKPFPFVEPSNPCAISLMRHDLNAEEKWLIMRWAEEDFDLLGYEPLV